MSHLCPRCGEGEMQPRDDAWELCDRCGFTCCLDDLERAAHRSPRSEINRGQMKQPRRPSAKTFLGTITNHDPGVQVLRGVLLTMDQLEGKIP